MKAILYCKEPDIIYELCKELGWEDDEDEDSPCVLREKEKKRSAHFEYGDYMTLELDVGPDLKFTGRILPRKEWPW